MIILYSAELAWFLTMFCQDIALDISPAKEQDISGARFTHSRKGSGSGNKAI
jgi:hypothetical protein